MSVAGIFILARHGDRQGFYQNPKTYAPTATNLTVLGYLQEYNLGSDIRRSYLNDTSPTFIQGIDAQIHQGTQVSVLADAGGEGTVIADSANAMLQGLYPPYDESITLANGTVVSWAGRAQPIPIQTIEAEQSIWLEGWTDCSNFESRLNKWYESSKFKGQAAIANPFYATLAGVLGSRPAKLENGWNLFDFLNVESIHNATLAPQIPAETLSYARYWANYHEAGSFTDADKGNVGNIAGQAILTPMLDTLAQLANTTNPLKLSYIAASYKPFLALFNMFDLPSPLKDSVVDYASAMIIEVRTDDTMRLLFRNGTAGDFAAYPLLGSSEASMSLSSFEKTMRPYAIEELSEWCDKCGETEARGCSVLAALNGTGGAGFADPTSVNGHHQVSPVVAGVIGAMVALAVAAAALAAWICLGGVVKRSKNGRSGRGVQNGDFKYELERRESTATSAAPDASAQNLVKPVESKP